MFLRNKENIVNSHGTFKVPWLTLAISTVVILFYCFGEDSIRSFVFDKSMICEGEIWRLFTGHLVHKNFDHLLWDLLGFIVLGGVIEHKSKRTLAVSLLVSMLAVSLWMFGVEQDYQIYYGLSGILNGLLVIAVAIKWSETKSMVFLYILLITAAKMIFEMATKTTFFIDTTIPTLPGTHLAGFIAGMVLITGRLRRNI